MNVLKIHFVEIIEVKETEYGISVEFIGNCYGVIGRYTYGFADMEAWEEEKRKGYVWG